MASQQSRSHSMDILNAKWNQCSQYKERLMSTGNALLIEDTAHTFWGRGPDGNGLNMLSEMQMQKWKNKQVKLCQRGKQKCKPNLCTGPNSATKEYNTPFLYCGVTGHHKDNCCHGTYIQCHDCGRWDTRPNIVGITRLLAIMNVLQIQSS